MSYCGNKFEYFGEFGYMSLVSNSIGMHASACVIRDGEGRTRRWSWEYSRSCFWYGSESGGQQESTSCEYYRSWATILIMTSTRMDNG